ncbi:MAG: Na+-translocating NADH-quinone reductase subunit C [Gammaproteobacteria bacterium]|nr:Na+-translocating NADH-quinone reductase subunit C [Gammaproteobacteria bacterium]MDH3449149.1 Na+-translocating NADH-quinone reductase subunit C [Gammaproteobacteria bacterium]
MSETANRDGTARALGVTLAVAFVCALLVSVVAVSLRPVQQANVKAERVNQLVREALSGIAPMVKTENLEAHVVELASGQFDDGIDPATFDAEIAASNPDTSVEIPREFDLARLRRRALHAPVYLLRGSDNAIHTIILPVSGRGYQSILRAWLLLDGAASKVRALRIYEQSDTPGVGSRIEDPDWQAQWRDRPIYDDAGVLRIGVRTRGGAETDEYAKYLVDGISGATRTARGVDGMVRFWLGDFGFGPFLQRIREANR